MDESYLRTEMLLGTAAMEILRGSHVAVFGLGGVGSWCAEALARSGIGELTLIDSDTVSESNLNRQSIALRSTVGMEKTAAAAARIADICPEIRVHPVTALYAADTRERFDWSAFDFIADCIDLVSCKLDLIETARSRGIPVISALGTGNKTDASLLRVCDISKTEGCPFARVMRKELRARGINHHTVVFSPEEGLVPEQRETPPPGRRSIPGSLVWVPASAGLLMAQHIVLTLAGQTDQ